jgi:threonine 3-dehydrogenase
VAATFRGIAKTAGERGALGIITRPERPPGPGEARVRVAAAGICGTDLEVYEWSPPIAKIMDGMLPMVIGHEFSGVVEAIGPDVDPALQGARVSMESHHACGECYSCTTGKRHVCDRLQYVGFHFDGGFAESAVVPVGILRVLPDGVDDLSAAIMEPFTLAVRAVDNGEGVAGKSVLITGCGALGIMSALVAHARGARTLILAEKDPTRLDLARQVTAFAGPDAIVDVGSEDLKEVVAAITEGQGVDVWIDWSGAQSSIDAGMASLTKGGEARVLGVYPPEVTIDLTRAVLRELRIQPLHGRLLEESWRAAIELLEQGAVDLGPVVTGEFPLEEYEAAFAAARERDGLKVLLRP